MKKILTTLGWIMGARVHYYPVTPLLSLIGCHCPPLKPDILDILLTIFEVSSVEARRGTGLVPVDAADRGAWNWHRDG